MHKLFISFLVLGLSATVYAKPRVNVTRSTPVKAQKLRRDTNVNPVILACKVQGTPSEFPNDLVVKNKGKETVKAGMFLFWSVKGRKGEFKLQKDLKSGDFVMINDVLGGGMEAGLECRVELKSKKVRLNRRLRLK